MVWYYSELADMLLPGFDPKRAGRQSSQGSCDVRCRAHRESMVGHESRRSLDYGRHPPMPVGHLCLIFAHTVTLTGER